MADNGILFGHKAVAIQAYFVWLLFKLNCQYCGSQMVDLASLIAIGNIRRK